MPPLKHHYRWILLTTLLVVSAGCQLFPAFGMHRTNRHGVPIQSEPDISHLEEQDE